MVQVEWLSLAKQIKQLADNETLIEAVRRRTEDELVEWRDSRRSMLCGNGLSIKERDGRGSEIIRLRTDVAFRMMLKFLAEELEKQ